MTDVTNFQPELTLRNAIRQMLKEEEAIGRGTLVRTIGLGVSQLLTRL